MTHTFNIDKGSIRLIVSDHGKVFRKATGLTIDPALWNASAKSLRAKCKDARVYEKLRLIHLRMEEKEEGEGVPPQEAIAYAIHGGEAPQRPKKAQEKETGVSFYAYFEEWANRDTPQKRQRRNTLKLIRDCMGGSWDWDGVDSAFYFRLVKELKRREYSVNYIGSVVKKLKTVMSEGYKLKYHTETDYHNFKSPMEQADTVYLTKDELDRLWALSLTDPLECRCRDLFLLGCYTAMRFSDYSRLTKDNIRDGVIHFTQKKTAGRVILPASPRVVKILDRNGGSAPKAGQVVLNRKIKELCLKARIFGKVEVTKSKGDKHETRMVEKYTLVSSHTARRTAATLLYQSGVPASSVMMITGHKSEADFYRYIRTTKEENAEALKSNPFFK